MARQGGYRLCNRDMAAAVNIDANEDSCCGRPLNFQADYRLFTSGCRKTERFPKIAYISFEMGLQYTNQPESAFCLDIFNLFERQTLRFFFTMFFSVTQTCVTDTVLS